MSNEQSTHTIQGELLMGGKKIDSFQNIHSFIRDGFIRSFDGYHIRSYSKKYILCIVPPYTALPNSICADNNDEYLVVITDRRVKVYHSHGFTRELLPSDMISTCKLPKMFLIYRYCRVKLLRDSFYVTYKAFNDITIILHYDYSCKLIDINFVAYAGWEMINFGDTILMRFIASQSEALIQYIDTPYASEFPVNSDSCITTWITDWNPHSTFYKVTYQNYTKTCDQIRILLTNKRTWISEIPPEILMYGRTVYESDTMIYVRNTSDYKPRLWKFEIPAHI